MIYAKKSLGQHFLTSQKALQQIVNASSLTANDIVLEIGPGKGALTERLLHTGATIFAIEKDILTETFAEYIHAEKLILITGDVLALDADTLDALLGGRSYKLVANIPYYITGEIIRLFLTTDVQPTLMTLLVQKEVAERIAREKKESVLSLSVKFFGEPMYIATVPAGAFSPPPRVDSAIITIQNISKKSLEIVPEYEYFKAVKAGFSARRKMLLGNLKKTYTEASIRLGFTSAHIKDTERAEDVPLQTWLQLIPHLKEKTKGE
jgi:16S rRNA (adenine1518-N6/adenine1519-N6)-dimethyltransferase